MSSLTTIPRDPIKTCGGISYVLLANYADVVGTIDASGYVTFADGDASVGTAFTKFVVTKETSNWTETGTGAAAQASSFYNQVLTLIFGRNDTVKRNNIKSMGTSELIAVVVERSGTAIALGVGNGLDMQSTTSTSGTAPGDLSGSTIVLAGNECNPHALVDDSELANILPA